MLASVATIASLVSFALASREARAVIDVNVCATLGDSEHYGYLDMKHFDGCNAVIDDCVKSFEAGENPWATASCVAAATCWGPESLNQYFQCKNESYDPASALDLDINVYASVLGLDVDVDVNVDLSFEQYNSFIDATISLVGSDGLPESTDFLKDYFWAPFANGADTVSYDELNTYVHRA
ncbi:hypothetical protein CYLTODRAFT_440726 [Cylindrobasidium torrendii FP15055 ss-10]|uniref:Uncharacterized protein n=1 Tax=Cylindrobasidium torrendii FP15055 ss-10 TaxID=1314674 RepID=A0A0D7BPH4_9AGAR|nr:hypothetical protein CYLTODRAFT_440726 [Cylindrobasidium torrendii FP15055 ss-10]